MGFPGKEYWSGLPFPSPGHLPDPGIKPVSPALQADFFISEPQGKPKHHIVICKIRSTLSSIKLDFKLFFNHWNYLVLRRVRVGDLPGDFSLLDIIAQLCPSLCDFMGCI